MQEIKLNACEKQKRWEWESIQARLYRVSIKGLKLNQSQQIGATFINQAKDLFISFLTVKAVIDGDMTLGMMMAVQYIIGQLNAPIQQFIGFTQQAQDARISLERLGEIHDKEDEEKPEDGKIKNIPDNENIELKNVMFQYEGPNSEKVLRDINLKIPANKVTAIVGTSGSGKTTLIKLLLGFYEPSGGKISLNCTELNRYSESGWRKRCGVVMQEGFIFSDTIANNIGVIDEEMEIIKKTYQRQHGLLLKGGVSEVQSEEARSRVIQSERSYANFLASLKSAEISMINQKRSLLEMQEQNHNNIEKFELGILDNVRTLKNLFRNWEDKYLVTSPIDGIVTLTNFWSENHVISVGERLATIVPADSSEVICKAIIPSSGIGKVEIGQSVNIKLSGYPYAEYGMLTGEVYTISLVPEKDGYVTGIRLSDGMVSSYSEQLKLVQEMEGVGDIVCKEMRLLYKFINPLKMIFDNNK